MACQRHDVARRMRGYVTRVEVGSAMECVEDSTANVACGNPWCQPDPVDDVAHAADVTDRLLRIATLEFPHRFASQRDVTMVNRRLHVVGHCAAQLERSRDVMGDVGVGPFELQSHLNVVGY